MFAHDSLEAVENDKLMDTGALKTQHHVSDGNSRYFTLRLFRNGSIFKDLSFIRPKLVT